MSLAIINFCNGGLQISANCNFGMPYSSLVITFQLNLTSRSIWFENGFDLMTEKNDLVGSSLQISFSADCYQGQFLISQVHISTFHFHCKEI